METYLYFAENLGADAAGDAAVFPAARFRGVDPISATTTRISFEATTGNAADDDILVTHTTGQFKELCEQLALALSDDSKGMVVFFDEDNLISYNGNPCGITELDITLDT